VDVAGTSTNAPKSMSNPIASFFSPPSVDAVAKDTKRDLSRTQRDLQRDARQLDVEERALTTKIKDAAKHQNQAELRALAKQIVQVRAQKQKLSTMNAHLGSMKTQATVMKTTHSMGVAMQQTSKAMGAMNKAMNPEKLQASMYDMQRNMAAMELSEEMMDDALSNAFDDPQTEGEIDEITRRTLDEIGIDSTAALGRAPTHQVRAAQQVEDEEVEAVMRSLLKG
jgi:charged multivesicular body protein 2B